MSRTALDQLYTQLQSRIDVPLIEGAGPVPARVMLILGAPTASAVVANQLDVGVVHAYLANLKRSNPDLVAHMFVTCTIKHQHGMWAANTFNDLHDEWEALDQPPITVLCGGAGALASVEPLDNRKVIWVPSIAQTIAKPNMAYSRWKNVFKLYADLFPNG